MKIYFQFMPQAIHFTTYIQYIIETLQSKLFFQSIFCPLTVEYRGELW